ncbi:MAG: CDP-alcohol phosphatidyltransferase family protein [Vampirovibrionales bacterium]
MVCLKDGCLKGNVANAISALRAGLALVLVGLLHQLFAPHAMPHPLPHTGAISAEGLTMMGLWGSWGVWGCFALSVAIIWMDGLDGWAARRLGEASKMGAVVDILCDRITEMVFWIGYLSLGWVPVAVPLVFLVRGMVVDALRAMALEQGYTAFGTTSLQQTALGVLLTSSRASRWLYAVCKAVVFSLLILVHHPQASTWPIYQPLAVGVQGLVWLTVVFCVIRGLPVLVESRRLFQTR